MFGTSNAGAANGDTAAAISDGMAALVSRHTGRGATSSRTTISKDLIVCVMADALTKGEKTLVQHGRAKAVLSIRRVYQETMAEEAIGMVEDLAARRVTAFMSNNHIDPDLAVEIFVLRPEPDGHGPDES